MSHVSRLPLGNAAPPWKLFVIHLQGGATDAARTCLVIKCHRRLSDALDAFVRRQDTLGRHNDAYSKILYDAALRLDDDVTDAVDHPCVLPKITFKTLLSKCKVHPEINTSN